eukprot:GHVH01007523.1.p1 GENE.GHVH01007523.1~~GHVH01007523.1.p1  ORF type:complete len:778 (+),score=87.31 GHVH01007523.1:1855-4188(+)
MADVDSPTIMADVPINFRDYYQTQLQLNDEFLDRMMTSFKEVLPQAFRINRSSSHSAAFEKAILSAADEADEPAERIGWYEPHGRAYHFKETDRGKIKRSPAWKATKKCIVDADTWGAITRQEFVSMVPPVALALSVDGGGYRVLDLCSAPGSKTNQIMDLMTCPGEPPRTFPSSNTAWVGTRYPKGLLIANDVEPKRLNTLIHQLSRCPSPIFGVQLSDASRFTGHSNFFDRVLCDVPCCGDGTLRKNMDIWKKWNCKTSLCLNPLQVGILKRGLSLLKVGGKLVYSTCSLNPLQDEAVIHHVLKESNGSLVLEDFKSLAGTQGLVSSPGITRWRVPNVEGTALLDQKPQDSTLSDSLFPGSDEQVNSQLKRCARFFPQANGSGGFFVAILVKCKPLPWGSRPKRGVKRNDEELVVVADSSSNSHKEEDVKALVVDADSSSNSPKEEDVKVNKKSSGFHATPNGIFSKINEAEERSIHAFYGIGEDFSIPTSEDAELIEATQARSGRPESVDFRDPECILPAGSSFNLMVKDSGPNKACLVSDTLFEVASGSEGGVARKFASVGAVAFQTHEGNRRCKWRVSQDASVFIANRISRRIVFVNCQAAAALLTGSNYLFRNDLLHLESHGGVSNLDSLRVRKSQDDEPCFEMGGCIAVVVPPRLLPWVNVPPENITGENLHRADLWPNTSPALEERGEGFTLRPDLPAGWGSNSDFTSSVGSLPTISCLVTKNGHLQGYCARAKAMPMLHQLVKGTHCTLSSKKRSREDEIDSCVEEQI